MPAASLISSSGFCATASRSPTTIGLVVPDGLPSLQLLLELVQQEREKQLSHFDSLDNKAGVTLGFAGLLIALGGDIDGSLVGVGALAAMLSAALSLLSFWPRGFPILDPHRLRMYLEADQQDTALRVHDTLVRMIIESRQLMESKAQRLRWALVFLAVAAASFAASILVSTMGRA